MAHPLVADVPGSTAPTRLDPFDPAPDSGPIAVTWLGRMPYRDAWGLQRRFASRRADDEVGDQLLLVEHDPVLTLGRHADEAHVRASEADLATRGIELIRVERGGEVTYHGPGQLVAYPIVAIARRGILVRPFVRALESAMIETCAALGVAAGRRDGHPGCWVDPDGVAPRKIGALGIRIERGVTYHGIALNIDPDLRDFDLIDACGMPEVVSTSIAVEGGRPTEAPSTDAVAAAGEIFARAFGPAIGVALVPGDAGAAGDTAAVAAR